jgi:hypothetical protein
MIEWVRMSGTDLAQVNWDQVEITKSDALVLLTLLAQRMAAAEQKDADA